MFSCLFSLKTKDLTFQGLNEGKNRFGFVDAYKGWQNNTEELNLCKK